MRGYSAALFGLASLGLAAQAQSCDLDFSVKTNILKGTTSVSSEHAHASSDMAYIWAHKNRTTGEDAGTFSMIVMYALPEATRFGREPVAWSNDHAFDTRYMSLQTMCQDGTCFDIPTYAINFRKSDLEDVRAEGLIMKMDTGERADTLMITGDEIGCFLDAVASTEPSQRAEANTAFGSF